MVSICGFHAEARLAVEQLQLARKVHVALEVAQPPVGVILLRELVVQEGTRTQLRQGKGHTPAPGAELEHPARREAARELEVKGHVLVVVLVLEVVVTRAIVDHVVHGGSAHPPSGIVCTSTVMPRKSDGAPVHVPATGMAWLGSRVTATRTSF